MRRILVLQHVANEIQGTLDPLLRRHGVRMRYVNFGRDPDAAPRLGGYQGLIVLGGPMSANDHQGHPHVQVEVELIRAALGRGLPILGICLGAQLLARALGARVEASPVPEIGWYEVDFCEAARSDPLFGGFAPCERLFQWHSDRFELPPGACRLAGSATCPTQAFRHSDRVYGLQFHLEADPPLISRWLETPEYRRGLPAHLRASGTLEEIARETGTRAGHLRQLAEQTFSAFLELT